MSHSHTFLETHSTQCSSFLHSFSSRENSCLQSTENVTIHLDFPQKKNTVTQSQLHNYNTVIIIPLLVTVITLLLCPIYKLKFIMDISEISGEIELKEAYLCAKDFWNLSVVFHFMNFP